MSGGLGLGQPITEESGSRRLGGIMAILFIGAALAIFLAMKYLPDSDGALEQNLALRQAAIERSVTLTEKGVALVSCFEVTCEEAMTRFNELAGADHHFALAKSHMNENGQPVAYIYIDRRLRLVENKEQ
jgi:hypothetical protein